jgi:hypothetical protein
VLADDAILFQVAGGYIEAASIEMLREVGGYLLGAADVQGGVHHQDSQPIRGGCGRPF